MAHAWKACWVHALGGSNPPSSAGGAGCPAGRGTRLRRCGCSCGCGGGGRHDSGYAPGWVARAASPAAGVPAAGVCRAAGGATQDSESRSGTADVGLSDADCDTCAATMLVSVSELAPASTTVTGPPSPDAPTPDKAAGVWRAATAASPFETGAALWARVAPAGTGASMVAGSRVSRGDDVVRCALRGRSMSWDAPG